MTESLSRPRDLFGSRIGGSRRPKPIRFAMGSRISLPLTSSMAGPGTTFEGAAEAVPIEAVVAVSRPEPSPRDEAADGSLPLEGDPAVAPTETPPDPTLAPTEPPPVETPAPMPEGDAPTEAPTPWPPADTPAPA